MTHQFQGSCHFGAVRFSYQGEKISKGIRCNCSICVRKGAMMSSAIAPDCIKIQAEEGVLGLYEFGTKTAKHYFCKKCGIYTFHQTLRQPGFYKANIGCLEGVDSSVIEVINFDGKNLL